MTPSEPEANSDVAALEPAIRRVVAARVANSHLVDDLVQETLTRVLEFRRSLEGGALLAYAVVSARNLVISEGRREDRHERLGPRLADLSQPESPEDAAMASEERRAVRRALRQLSHNERATLVAREVEGRDNASLAKELRASPGAVSLRLFRARAKLRVEYLLALGGVQPPTAACRPVLLALSAGDRRRQRDLDAGGHLLSCGSCAALSQDLLERHRPVPVVWPLLPLAASGRWVRTRLRRRPIRAATAVAAAGASLGILLIARSEDPAACGGTLTVDGSRVGIFETDRLTEMAGRSVDGENLPVQSVPANEGFWLGCADGRVWVQMTGVGESPERISPGRRLELRGIVTSHADGYANSVGVDLPEGGAQLDRQRFHLEVGYRDIRLR